ncbi:uncharacterized protein PAC_14785 [Phialocephala subalpina]|uniref:Uncharacterized protein n=1 Tax=Phialocephala subalpina TaxID=576137 RepID=A0A1L7XIL7_9HELO|nr:uncharacterized protein PAC_14785 [Phialocephala subalpina]
MAFQTHSHNNFALTPYPSVKSFPMTGVRCPTCAGNGQEVWVIPGRACAYCEYKAETNGDRKNKEKLFDTYISALGIQYLKYSKEDIKYPKAMVLKLE